MSHDLYDAAGADLRRMVCNEARRRRDEYAERVDWADQSDSARDAYRQAERRRIALIEGREENEWPR